MEFAIKVIAFAWFLSLQGMWGRLRPQMQAITLAGNFLSLSKKFEPRRRTSRTIVTLNEPLKERVLQYLEK